MQDLSGKLTVAMVLLGERNERIEQLEEDVREVKGLFKEQVVVMVSALPPPWVAKSLPDALLPGGPDQRGQGGGGGPARPAGGLAGVKLPGIINQITTACALPYAFGARLRDIGPAVGGRGSALLGSCRGGACPHGVRSRRQVTAGP